MSTAVSDAPIDPQPDPIVGIHYQLCGYIVPPSSIMPAPFEGWASFTTIFQQRPKEARFAIGRRVPLLNAPADPSTPLYEYGEPTGPFVVWDLKDNELVRGQRTDGNGFVMPPPPLWFGDTEDGMVMKALAFL